MIEANERERDAEDALNAPLSIMVVDDDESTRAVLGHVLRREGYAVVPCRDAVCGLEQLKQGPAPDMIVLDLLMPKMNGWQFRIEQKRNARWANIPVIALSGDVSPQAAAIDAAAYLTKPLDHVAFVQTVRVVVDDLRRRRAVARASELERLVSLGTLMGGIAHQINNPLTFLSGNVDALQRLLTGIHIPISFQSAALVSARRALDRVRTGVDRIAAVMRPVSMFAFADASLLEPIDVHDVLEASLQIASNELRHCARLECVYTALPRVRANPASLGQVFLNLLLNAVFTIRDHEEDGHFIRVESATRGEHAVITVTESASRPRESVGIRLFDPLASDDTSGRMDLRFGLAISRELVEAIGGSIEFEAKEPRGSTFRVVLPSCDRISYPAPSGRPWEAGERAKVLVIDDDPLVCELFETLLATDYEVSAFSAPLHALAALLGGQFDVVLCDVMMPELDGIALYERAIQARPELRERFVFVTGGAFTARARIELRGTQRLVLQKPCHRHELLDAINATLRADSTRAAAKLVPGDV